MKAMYRNTHNNTSLAGSIVRFILGISSILLLLATCVVFFFVGGKMVDDYVGDITKRIERSAELINREMMVYISNSSYIASNNYFIDGLQKDFDNSMEAKYNFYQQMSLFFRSFSESGTGVLSTNIIYSNRINLFESEYTSKLDRIKDNIAVQKAMASKIETVVWDDDIKLVDGKKYLTFYRNISTSPKNISLLETRIPYSTVEFMIKSAGLSNVAISYGNKYFYGGVSFAPSETNRYKILEAPLINNQKIYAAIPLHTITYMYFQMLPIVILVFIILCVAIAFSVYRMSFRMTDDLVLFIKSINTDEQMPIKINKSDYIELMLIKEKISEMLEHIKKIQNEADSARMVKIALEGELLLSRLDPHLLYNSLATIKWNAVKKRDRTTALMVESLSKYYRYVLGNGDIVTTLQEEIERICEYIKIMENIHNVTYEVEVDIVNEIMQCSILKLLLQPIIENAILHGVNRMENAKIWVTGRKENEFVILTIKDNGFGMDETIASKLMMGNHSGYGIKNIVQRIKLYYGDKADVKIVSQKGRGTEITLTILNLTKDEIKQKVILDI